MRRAFRAGTRSAAELDIGEAQVIDQTPSERLWDMEVTAGPATVPMGLAGGRLPNRTGRVRPFEKIPDQIVRLVGEVVVGWNALDYAMRLSAKRLEGVALQSDRGRTIMSESGHGKVISILRTSISRSPTTESVRQSLELLLIEIGAKRDEGLYGRRNRLVHSLWTISPDGGVLRRRVGTDEWVDVHPVGEDEIATLVSRIRDVAHQLLQHTQQITA